MLPPGPPLFTLLRPFPLLLAVDIQVKNKSSGVVRWIGRCETDDLSNWEKETPAGCPTIFGPDAVDPDNLDVYTNSYTAYEGVHLFFPSFYHHFGHNPNGFGNDGLLDIRLVVSRDGYHVRFGTFSDHPPGLALQHVV